MVQEEMQTLQGEGGIKKNRKPFVIIVLILALIAVGILIARALPSDEEGSQASPTPTVTESPAADDAMMEEENGTMTEDDGDTTVDPSVNSGQEGEVKVFDLTGTNYEFSVAEIRVKKGDRVKIVFSNDMGFHDWSLDEFDVSTDQIQAGNTTEVEFVADKVGTFEYFCSVGNHRSLGMVGRLVVEE